ncbi:MAG TPA: TetR/AcrR family transcriptional regulator [Galbitalea sp.]
MTDILQRPTAADRTVPAILEAAQIVIDRLGHDKLSLAEIARVSLIPLARIYQFFADRNAVLGALSARELDRLSRSIDTRGVSVSSADASQRVGRVVDRFASFLDNSSSAYLVLCGPFDQSSTEPRLEAVHRLGLALGHALGSSASSPELLDYAAELVFACFRRAYLVDGQVTSTSIEMAQHAARSFLGAPETV